MKLPEFIKFKKAEISMFDFDEPYRFYFYRKYIITFLFFLLCGGIIIYIKAFYALIFVILGFFGYIAYISYDVYLSLTNQILVMDGECTAIDTAEYNPTGIRDFGFGTCKLTITLPDGFKLSQNVPTINKYKEGDIVRIYYKKGSMDQINDNTFRVVNPVFMHKFASK